MLSAASAWSSCSSAKLIRSTSLTPGLAVALRGDPGNSGIDAEVGGAVMPRVVSSSRAHIQLACACASLTSSVPEAAASNEAGAGTRGGGSLLSAAASRCCVSLSRFFVVAELATCGMAGSPGSCAAGGSAKGAGAEEASRPNATSMPRRNCVVRVDEGAGAREALDGL